MAGTFGQFYAHIIFTPKHRANVIREAFREELQMYMTGIIQGKKHKVLAIYCMPDHVHVLIGLKPYMALSDLVQILKKESTNFINDKKWIAGKFSWQEGYGYFSHSHSELDKVIHYIQNQPEHHKKRSFREEYLEILQRCEVDFKEEYLFEWISDEGDGN
jgi:REP element-mobilizing transposase RayT